MTIEKLKNQIDFNKLVMENLDLSEEVLILALIRGYLNFESKVYRAHEGRN